jgi:hypothetical protein
MYERLPVRDPRRVHSPDKTLPQDEKEGIPEAETQKNEALNFRIYIVFLHSIYLFREFL